MNKGVLRRTVLLTVAAFAVFAACGVGRVRAAEFCPARVESLLAVKNGNGAFAFGMYAPAARKVTGALLVEADGAWYRVPFPPLAFVGARGHFASVLQYVTFPNAVTIRNVWLAQAASDDPRWAAHGVVSCPPAPHRVVPHGEAPPQPKNTAPLAAVPIPAPLVANCAKPFAEAIPDEATLHPPMDLGAGEDATTEVDLDAQGNVFDTGIIDASFGQYELAKKLEDSAKLMRFTPAVAYCKAVPSMYILRVGESP
jgi:hypothetical protein